MPPRRCSASAARDYSDMESDEYEDGHFLIRCLSCEEEFDPEDAGTCKECYEEANETEEELKRQIEDLKSKVAFLKLLSPADRSLRPNAPATDVVLIPFGDLAAPPNASVPAHRAVLVSNHVTILPDKSWGGFKF